MYLSRDTKWSIQFVGSFAFNDACIFDRECMAARMNQSPVICQRRDLPFTSNGHSKRYEWVKEDCQMIFCDQSRSRGPVTTGDHFFTKLASWKNVKLFKKKGDLQINDKRVETAKKLLLSQQCSNIAAAIQLPMSLSRFVRSQSARYCPSGE